MRRPVAAWQKFPETTVDLSPVAPGAWANNFPDPLTSFVGRAWERDQVQGVLASTRLLVLTGAGGAGKTRLALAVARASAASFPGGAWWVELAPVRSPAGVEEALADVLGLLPLPGRTPTQAVVQRLAGERVLVVLDNCEHVLEAAADLVEVLLRGCPQVTVLATSRIPLGVPGESDWRVPSLSLPSIDSPDVVVGADATRLFVERAAKVRPDFALRSENLTAVARICRELDGLPLAIELAAARVRVMTPDQIADGLGDRFRLLTGGPRGALPRHQTLRGSVDWSHDLLSEAERMLFRRLSVFTGGWSLEAVEAVAAGHDLPGEAILDLLTSLVDKSLVVADAHGRVARYRLLETVRQYAAELLVQNSEVAALRGRHQTYYLGLAERLGDEIHTPRVRAVVDALTPESANLQSAIDHALGHRPEDALRIAVALTGWWKISGQFAAGQSALSRALAAADPAPGPLRARALWSCSHMAQFRGDGPTAARCAQEALAMAESIGDEVTLVLALLTVATAKMRSDAAGSRPIFLRGVEIARRLGDPWLLLVMASATGRSFLLTDDFADAEHWLAEAASVIAAIGVEAVTQTGIGLGWAALERGDFDACFRLSGEAGAAAAELGDSVADVVASTTMARAELLQGWPEAAYERARATEARAIAKGGFMVLSNIRVEVGRSLAALGRLAEARERLEQVVSGSAGGGYYYGWALVALADVLRALGEPEAALARAREAAELGDRLGIPSHGAAGRELMARLAMDRGEWSEAEAMLHDALAQRLDAGSPIHLPPVLDALARVAAGLESPVEAARLLGAADRARADLGLVRWPLDTPAMDAVEEALGSSLGAEPLATARAEGAAMPLEEAVGWVRRARGSRKRPPTGWEALTPTEVQVVDLVAQGLSNPEIAERMFIARGTVKVHLGHVFQKLEVRSRSELAAFAVRREG